MGRGATVAAGNVWYEARIAAAKWNEKLYSRAGTEEATGGKVKEGVIADVERNMHKCMPVDVAVILADVYNAPQLLNHYCLNDCPIGCRQSISDELLEIDRVTVKLLKNLKVDQLSSIKDKLIDIASDGVVSEDEVPDLQEIINYLDELSKTVSELKIIGRIALNGGRNNGAKESYHRDS